MIARGKRTTATGKSKAQLKREALQQAMARKAEERRRADER